ncbi:type IV secretory system conjugative DNA transfer family protein [Novosphingobium sp.]|uniref:type IV secretory system conjugative DNA transfer family protein n=1 Tax=Novosphingobium sp. TaxID=1874826 RepID=UPI003BA946B5
MVWRVGARVHAFVHGLFKPSEAELVLRQWDEVAQLHEQLGIADPSGKEHLAAILAETVCDHIGIPEDHEEATRAHRLIVELLNFDALFVLPVIDWSQTRTIAELWDIRAELSRQRALAASFDRSCNVVVEIAIAALAPIHAACPSLLDGAELDGIRTETSLLRSLGDVGAVTEAMLVPIFDGDGLSEVLPHLRQRLEANLILASGGNPSDPRGFNRAPKLPSQADSKDPEALVRSYFGGTPFLPLFDQVLDFTIPTKSRFEHHHIVAGSGHGKTQTLQYLIANDLEAVADGNRTVIVLDSQGDLIRTISNLKIFAPGQPLHDRVVIIDPSDVEWPVSLNLFDVGMERLSGYAPLERERLTNSILELYDFVLGTLLSAEMTQKQNVIFRYVTRLMLHIPDATIHTLRELMEPGSEKKFAEHIAKLTGTARHFFETEFAGKEFEQTKKQVLRRLWGILENQTFERMFAHPRSKLDLFAEMNAGKIILINTAKDLLKEQGTEIFGRFFIAMIAQAAQERATLPANKRTPTIVYVDEAQDYFDRNIGLILAQARKYNVGMVLAHQYLGQLEPKLQEAFAANTAIKFAGGVSAKDARALAPMMYCSPELIEAQPKGSFAVHVRGQTKGAVPLSFPFGYMEQMQRMERAEREALRTVMRERYAVHYSELEDHAATSDPGDGELTASQPESPAVKSGSTSPKQSPKPKSRPSPEDTPGHIDTDAGEEW